MVIENTVQHIVIAGLRFLVKLRVQQIVLRQMRRSAGHGSFPVRGELSAGNLVQLFRSRVTGREIIMRSRIQLRRRFRFPDCAGFRLFFFDVVTDIGGRLAVQFCSVCFCRIL